MAIDYHKYLAANVLNDGKIVTYRTLSRALNIHCNTAKRMLYDFYTKQNAMHKDSLHATYVVCGSKPYDDEPLLANPVHGPSADVSMQSSPDISSSMPPGTSNSTLVNDVVMLTRGESLEGVKASFISVTCVHIYSIETSTLHNLQTLSAVLHHTVANNKVEALLPEEGIYGTIRCAFVERRVMPDATLQRIQGLKNDIHKPTIGGQVKSDPEHTTKLSDLRVMTASDNFTLHKEGAKSIEAPSPASSTSRSRGKGSDLMKAFANSRARSSLSRQSSSASKHTPKDGKVEESSVSMKSDSEEESGNTILFEKKSPTGAARQAREAREKQLRDMMDDEDIEMSDIVQPQAQQTDPLEEPLKKSIPLEEIPPHATTGRRRGRRRVTKKSTTKDAEGFLVTREEQIWESFSEDDTPATTRPKPSVSSATSTNKKGAAKGSGNIMSFFGKK